MILRSYTQNSPLLVLTYPVVITSIILLGQQELWLKAQYAPLPWISAPFLNFGFIAVIFFNASLANLIYNRSELYHSPTYLTGLIYAVFVSITCVQTGNFYLLLAQMCSLISTYFAFSIFRQKKISHQLFLSALFMGVASLLDKFYLTFPLVLIFLSLWNRPFSVKDLIIILIGFLTPFLYWNSYNWLIEYSLNPNLSWTFLRGCNDLYSSQPSMPFNFCITFSVILAVLSLPLKEERQSNKTVQSKQYLILLFIISMAAMTIEYILNQRIKINEFVSFAPILLLSHYWTHYRTSLLSPFVFYITMLIAIIEFFHWF
jgi:hypothetical protein